jgi:NitT/TauT family transport system substrate-binding protein
MPTTKPAGSPPLGRAEQLLGDVLSRSVLGAHEAKHPAPKQQGLLKAADLCVAAPERAAQRLVDGGFTERYDYALEALSDIPYRSCREYDPEDSLRF